MNFLTKLIGDPSDRDMQKRFRPLVKKINELEESFSKKTDEEIRAYTGTFRAMIAEGKTVDDILPEAFAVVREAAKRTIGQRHYDVQLIGGMVLHYGNIAEMRTGEGKTLVATLPVYVNALSGAGVHVVTVNDYLARRDAVWMGKIYHFLGLSIACIQHDKSYLYDPGVMTENQSEPEEEALKQVQDSEKEKNDEDEAAHSNSLPSASVKAAADRHSSLQGEDASVSTAPLVTIDYDNLRTIERREAYAADITYGTNNEFGFDYLRDNMVGSAEQMVQRDFHYAIVDEVDSILIDEARTPLIISAPDMRPTDQYLRYAALVRKLVENEDYNTDEKMRSSTLTEGGIKKMEEWLDLENIYTEGGLSTVHHIEQALKAHALFQIDKDYVVRDGEVVIIDEFTGRMMEGRRYSEGLHQAIEAKEGVDIKKESRTLATITFQNYFRLYPKLSGMTGTAKTEEEEFYKIYGLGVYVVPTNKPIDRTDEPDRVYKNRKGKYEAVIKEIRERNKSGQPVLVGTISIEQNEYFSGVLAKAGIEHEILNAKNHEREAEIVSQAGRAGAVTLATNMAGRGVDIVLGGTPYDAEKADEVKKAGGLCVIGTERHESRRIDNQLRGRAGRQGDPGSSRFYVSVEDDLMRIFGSDRLQHMMNRLGVPDDMPIENRIVSRSIESAQKKVEGHNFDIRKHVVQYDDVTNRHREAIYRRRREILHASNEGELRERVFEMIEQEIAQVVNFHTASTSYQDWNVSEIEETMKTIFPPDVKLTLAAAVKEENERDRGKDAEMRSHLIKYLSSRAHETYDGMVEGTGDTEEFSKLERIVLLNAIDTLWMDHLEALDNLRTAVGLRGYGQRDPLVEYKRDAYQLFQQLTASIQNQIVYSIFKIFHARKEAMSATLQKALAGSMAAISGMRFSAPAKTMSQRNETPTEQGSGSGTSMVGGGSLSESSSSADAKHFAGEKVGRNDVCPCGSGKKFKKCHGAW